MRGAGIRAASAYTHERNDRELIKQEKHLLRMTYDRRGKLKAVAGVRRSSLRGIAYERSLLGKFRVKQEPAKFETVGCVG
jgi:hypothetical protein